MFLIWRTTSFDDLIEDFDLSGANAIENLSEALGISEEELTIMINAEDNASETINAVSEEEITDKFVQLEGEDNATPLINLWNIMSTDPKFSSLSAEDHATCVFHEFI